MSALDYVKRLVPADVKRRMRGLMGAAPVRPTTVKTWVTKPEEVPWFDRLDALDRLAERRRRQQLSERDVQLLQEWVTKGYFVIPRAVRAEPIDGMMRELDRLWTAVTPHKDLRIEGLNLSADSAPDKVSHAELLALPPAVRTAARDRSNWRVHGFPSCSTHAAAILRDAELDRLASLIVDRPMSPEYSINFMYGSAQSEHQDTAVFHVHPANYIVGAWIACEDISRDAGPLMFYPGSHHEPIFAGFPNYPQTNLRTASADGIKAYETYMAGLARKYTRELFLAKKGDVLFWHGMVMHGGSPRNNPQLTRRSFVIHYIPPGMDVGDQVVGPFNW
jgi:phytanoyl-CoA hydroxylase